MTKLVTLTSDWHNSDYYSGAVKASILSKIADVNFIDISNSIQTFNHIQAAFILKSVYNKFPAGTIHIFAVNSELDDNEHFAVAKYEEQYFIANDNGSLGLIFDNKPEIVVKPDTGNNYTGSTFPELSVFCDIVSFILKNGDIKEIGNSLPDVVRKPRLLPQIDKNEINATIIYIDSYQNAITNITKDIFDKYISGKNFLLSIENSSIKINSISNSYKDVETGSILCLFNSLDLLEIAIRDAKLCKLLNLSTKLQVRIKF